MATTSVDENPSFQPGSNEAQLEQDDIGCNVDSNEDIDGDEWPSQEYSDWDPEFDGEDIDNSDIVKTKKDPKKSKCAALKDSTAPKMDFTLTKGGIVTPKSNSVVTGPQGVSEDDIKHDHDSCNRLEEFKNDPIGAESASMAMTQPEESYYDREGIVSTKFGGDNEDEEKRHGFRCWQCSVCQSINSLVPSLQKYTKYT